MSEECSNTSINFSWSFFFWTFERAINVISFDRNMRGWTHRAIFSLCINTHTSESFSQSARRNLRSSRFFGFRLTKIEIPPFFHFKVGTAKAQLRRYLSMYLKRIHFLCDDHVEYSWEWEWCDGLLLAIIVINSTLFSCVPSQFFHNTNSLHDGFCLLFLINELEKRLKFQTFFSGSNRLPWEGRAVRRWKTKDYMDQNFEILNILKTLVHI